MSFIMLNRLFPLRAFQVMLTFALLAIPALAKETPLQVVDWPVSGAPVLRFTFAKFKSLSGMSNIRGYVMNIEAQNLSPQPIVSARFSVYIFDKNKTRIGEDQIAVTNLGPNEIIKLQSTVTVSGSPASVSVQNMAQVPKGISLTINSIPQGAVLKLDGAEVGTTPRNITVNIGKHILTFSKEGFNVGNFPLEISREDVSGGSVSYELGAANFDSIELRDGSVLNGDLVSVSGMDVQIRVAGNLQHIDRNRIKRVMFTQREAPTPDLPRASTNNP